MSNEMEKFNPFVGSGFENLVEDANGYAFKLANALDKRTSLESERDQAIAKAAQPFLLPLSKVNEKINNFEDKLTTEKISEGIKEVDLDDNSKIAFDLILRKNEITLFDFAKSITEFSKNQELSRPVIKSNNELIGFRALNRDLNKLDSENRQLPIGIFTLDWSEQRDIQAEFDGYSGSTGIFDKTIFGHFGFAGQDSLTIENEDVSSDGAYLPILRPKSILLAISNAIEIRNQTDFGLQKTTTNNKEDVFTGRILDAEPMQKRLPHRYEINWQDSQTMNYDLIVNSSQQYKQVRARSQTFISWGDRLLTVLDKLAKDDKFEPKAHISFQKVKEHISSNI